MDALQKGDHGRQIGIPEHGGNMDTIQIKAEDVQSGDVIVEKHPTGGTVTRWPVDAVYPTSVIPAGDVDGNAGKTEVTAVLVFPSGAMREVSFLATDKLTVERAS